jgi:two-component system LytT family response regulator
VRTIDIDWCEAAGNYVRIHVGPLSHLIRKTMSHVESDLDPARFVRIHRSSIVNVDRIQELQPSFNGEYVVLLHGGTRLTLSRSYREELQTRLGKPF